LRRRARVGRVGTGWNGLARVGRVWRAGGATGMPTLAWRWVDEGTWWGAREGMAPRGRVGGGGDGGGEKN
jgi:hypothetical protein